MSEWATSRAFVDSPTALTVGLTAKTFGQRPSGMLGLSDPVVAYALDEAIALRLLFDEAAAMKAARSGSASLPPGQRYESTSEALGMVH